jgi:hypothetical protein
VLFFGVFSTLLAFTAEPLGGILRVRSMIPAMTVAIHTPYFLMKMCVSVMGAMSGPMVGIFVLALFFPRAGRTSTLVSFVLSNVTMVIICAANYVADPYVQHFFPTNST